MKEHIEKKREYRFRAIQMIAAIIFISLLVEIIMLGILNEKNGYKTAGLLLNEIVSVIEKNDASEEELVSSLKEDYMTKARTVAYILDGQADQETDMAELEEISDLMGIDEIHLFDQTGTIYFGTNPEYYGYSFDSGEQMAFFKPMLDDRSLSMCQDVTPNTADGKNMMYAISWNTSGTYMVQVGIEPKRLLAQLAKNEISVVLENIPSYNGISIYIVDNESATIVGATGEKYIGKPLDELGIDTKSIDDEQVYNASLNMDGYRVNCSYCRVGDYTAVVASSTHAYIESFLASVIISLVYMMGAGVLIFLILSRLFTANSEREEQLAILTSMSEIYTSMHLLDLENDQAEEYFAEDTVREIVNKRDHAAQMMYEIMNKRVSEPYRQSVLDFADLETLQERMISKKIITCQFVGIRGLWFEAAFISIENLDDGRPRQVVFTTRCIDGEKRKEEQLLHTSTTDGLTGLYNRRAYEEAISHYMGEYSGQDDLVYVSMDVNELKNVNDSLGHAAGDELLRGAAQCMRSSFEAYGRVYRIGGDEFAALINADKDMLADIMGRFAASVKSWSGTMVHELSISSGFTGREEVETGSVKEMAILADQRMYAEKSNYYKMKGIDRRGQIRWR